MVSEYRKSRLNVASGVTVELGAAPDDAVTLRGAEGQTLLRASSRVSARVRNELRGVEGRHTTNSGHIGKIAFECPRHRVPFVVLPSLASVVLKWVTLS